MKHVSTIRVSKKALTLLSFEFVGGEKLRTYSTKEIGDQGESIVVDFEKKRLIELGISDPNVKWVASQKGLGYDVESVGLVESGVQIPSRFIEVKATTRITKPDSQSLKFMFSFNLTRNEWHAAETYLDEFYIYVVSLSRLNRTIYMFKNPYKKYHEGKLSLSAPTYNVKISTEHIDSKMKFQ